MPDIFQTVMECQQLESLYIYSPYLGWKSPELDLRNLAHLCKCQLRWVAAPGVLPSHKVKWGSELDPMGSQHGPSCKTSCRIAYTVSIYSWLEHCGHGLQACMPSLSYSSWRLNVRMFPRFTEDDMLDLACFAHIPHVSLRSKGMF